MAQLKCRFGRCSVLFYEKCMRKSFYVGKFKDPAKDLFLCISPPVFRNDSRKHRKLLRRSECESRDLCRSKAEILFLHSGKLFFVGLAQLLIGFRRLVCVLSEALQPHRGICSRDRGGFFISFGNSRLQRTAEVKIGGKRRKVILCTHASVIKLAASGCAYALKI